MERRGRMGKRWGVGILAAWFWGVVTGLATEPLGWWPLAWIGLMGLWLCVLGGDGPGRSRCGWLGLAWGLGYNGTGLFWLTGLHPMTWLGVPWLQSLAIAVTCWIVATLWGSVVPTAWAIAMGRWGSSEKVSEKLSAWRRVLVGAALWCGLEWLMLQTPLWWPSLALTQSPNNLAIAHLGRLSGTSAIAAVMVASAGLAAVAWRSRSRSGAIAAAVLVIAGHGIGGLWLLQPLNDVPETALNIGIIQGNIPNELKFGSEGWRRALLGYTRGYEILADRGVDLVLLPETAMPVLWDDAARTNTSLGQAIGDRQVPALVGTFLRSRDRLTNSLILETGRDLDRTARPNDRYDKVQLVPLGEYIPFEDLLGNLIDRLSPLDAHLAKGDRDQILDTPWGRAIAAICYDSAYGERFRTQAHQGGQFIVSAANDAHYRQSMYAQHHAQDVLRAIETDRWAARATNTGYSAIVDPHGHTPWRSPAHEYVLHNGPIHRRAGQTPYVRWGDWLTPTLVILAIATRLIPPRPF